MVFSFVGATYRGSVGVEAGWSLRLGGGRWVQKRDAMPDTHPGPWQELGPLGAGAMAVVSLVERDGVVGVLKRVRPDQRENQVFRDLLRVEIAALRAVRHPAVIALLDAGDDWLVLERADRSAGFEPFVSWASAGPLLDRVRDALLAGHRAGVLHRDPKLPNVLWTERGWVLADWGAARVEGLADPAPALGTPASMAPERLAGHAASVASDVFAFGVLAFELLCGRSPYPDRWEALLAAHRRPPPPILPRFEAPREVERFVRAALSPSPADRPSLIAWGS